MVVGSSVGALNAAYYAGAPTAEGVERLAKIWLSLRQEDVFPVTWRTMLTFLLRRDFLVPADGVRWLVDTYLPYRNLEDARLPVHVVATDLLSGEPVVLSKGSASRAIVASTAIPAAFPPSHYLTRACVCLTDGGFRAVSIRRPRSMLSCSLRRVP